MRDADGHSGGRKRWWKATSTGFRFTPGDEESRAAALALTAVLEQVEGDLPGQWLEKVEPGLEVEWRRLSGRTNTQVAMTIEELSDLQAALEELLAPYVQRNSTETPPQARNIRFLRYTLSGLAKDQLDVSS